MVAEQLREYGIEADIVLEPVRAIWSAVAVVSVFAADEIATRCVMVLAADHVVRNPEEFRQVCRRAADAAPAGRIVTFGIAPTYPATNYGYSYPGDQLNGGHAVKAFVEKHDAATTATYVADGYCLERSAISCFTPRPCWRKSSALSLPWRKLPQRRSKGLTRDHDFLRLALEPFARAPKKSDRLRRYGAHQARGHRSGRHRLVRRRQLERGLGRTSIATQAGNAIEGPVVMLDTPQQSCALGGIHTDHRDRAR